MNKPLPTRRLGASRLDVTGIGLGLMSLSGTYGASSDDNGIAVIHHARIRYRVRRLFAARPQPAHRCGA